MSPKQIAASFCNRNTAILVFLLLFVPCLISLPVSAQEAPYDHAGMSMFMDDYTPDTATPAERLSWKRESELNHHLAGFFVLLAGLFVLMEVKLSARISLAQYVWPVCFLLSGLFVLVFSDTELWPFGPKPWIQGVITNPEVIQHKIFAVILVAIGAIEFARARKRLNTWWSGWVFPLTAIAGSVLLLFHQHSAGMHGPDHMATMARIQSEHLSYSAAGLAIGLAKGLAELPMMGYVE